MDIDNNQPLFLDEEMDTITLDDQTHGRAQFYNAFVLHATQDKAFVDQILQKMNGTDIKICTEDNLLPTANKYVQIARLISSDRCLRLIVILSPEYLTSPEHFFLLDYMHAVYSEQAFRKLLPIYYRNCEVPLQFRHYHKLYYVHQNVHVPPSEISSFWTKLRLCLEHREERRPALDVLRV